MDTSRRRFIRLAIVTATAAGVALASPVVAVADDSEVVETATTGESYDPPVVTTLTTEPVIIELVIEGSPPTDPIESPDGDGPEDPTEPGMMPAATDTEPISTEPGLMIAALETGSDDDHTGGTGEDHTGGTGEDHTGGTGEDHTGGTGGEHTGSGGTGDPYQVTFEVTWEFPDGSTIPVLEVQPEWRSMFDLAAESATGGQKPKPTLAHCTYPAGSTDLVCEFQNPGKHASVTDGMIVPRKPTATYSVTVLWPVSGWTIDGANAESYSARDLCSRGEHGGGGGGHDGGHESGHGETLEVAALQESGSVCIHTVLMRQSPVASDPPVTEPPVTEVPAVTPPQSQTPAPTAVAPTMPSVEVLPVTVTPKALPATGNTATTTLMIGAIVLALGGCLSVLARRRDDLQVS